MEINTEINRIFGEEIAKIYANSIDEEDLKQTAQQMFDKLKEPNRDQWSKDNRSELEKLISKYIQGKVLEEVQNIMDQPEEGEELRKHAEDLVQRIKELSDKLIVDAMAQHIVERTVREDITYAINGHMDRLVELLWNRQH